MAPTIDMLEASAAAAPKFLHFGQANCNRPFYHSRFVFNYPMFTMISDINGAKETPSYRLGKLRKAVVLRYMLLDVDLSPSWINLFNPDFDPSPFQARKSVADVVLFNFGKPEVIANLCVKWTNRHTPISKSVERQRCAGRYTTKGTLNE